MTQSPFRQVQLSPSIPGRLYLTCMPGYHRGAGHHLAHWSSLADSATAYVLCLAGAGERARKAPDYQEFLDGIGIGDRWAEFPIPDRSAPANTTAFAGLLDRLCQLLRSPANIVVIHCAAGVGRTGMVAASLLVRLGIPCEEALAQIGAAGSEPETGAQMFVVESIRRAG
jgi:hypothetical protein